MSITARLSILLLCALCLTGILQTRAAGQSKIEWTDLQPKLPPLADPLAKLTEDQRFDFETIMYVRALPLEAREIPVNAQAIRDARLFEKRFKKAGIDIETLNSEIKNWQGKIKKRGQLVNGRVDGKDIRIAGYLLPLEFADDGVREFLLVPYVGACIHVPPPPPNQIIYIRSIEKFQPRELFVPAWITGTLKAKSQSKNLTLVDGSTDIALGYEIDGAVIKEYAK